ncbi:hypothetical protein [Vibrio hepatarius]|uniref:hypothetical protein n=1 Tax=Vibrio hepatarius TaxID=171383 RepID=UPI001C09FFF2|nr:hypothetical protein [Vibrio hepatarius]MBU2898901.1 hypothetical protein [Vibrio hepatarius]
MNNLIDLAKVIGSGLTNQNCYLSLQRVNQEEGTFWSYRGDAKSGIWCSHSDWAAGVTQISSLNSVPDDLMPAMIASLFSIVSVPFVRDINTQGEAASLPSDIYPVVQCNGYQFVLVGFSPTWIKRLTVSWTTYSAPPIKVKVPLISGYMVDPKPVLEGEGVWLRDGHSPDSGTAILWWGKPIASIQYHEEKTWFVNKLYAPYSLTDQVSYVQIATLDMNLQDILLLENTQVFEADLICEVESKLISNGQCVARGELLVSQDGVVFYTNQKLENEA